MDSRALTSDYRISRHASEIKGGMSRGELDRVKHLHKKVQIIVSTQSEKYQKCGCTYICRGERVVNLEEQQT